MFSPTLFFYVAIGHRWSFFQWSITEHHFINTSYKNSENSSRFTSIISLFHAEILWSFNLNTSMLKSYLIRLLFAIICSLQLKLRNHVWNVHFHLYKKLFSSPQWKRNKEMIENYTLNSILIYLPTNMLMIFLPMRINKECVRVCVCPAYNIQPIVSAHLRELKLYKLFIWWWLYMY